MMVVVFFIATLFSAVMFGNQFDIRARVMAKGPPHSRLWSLHTGLWGIAALAMFGAFLIVLFHTIVRPPG